MANILIVTPEYVNAGSGIALVVEQVSKLLKKKHTISIASPEGPDIKLGSQKMIKMLGGFGILYFWKKVAKHIKKNDYDLIWCHNPLFLKKVNNENIISTVHTAYVTHYRLSKKRVNKILTLYYKIMKEMEAKCYKKNHFMSTCITKEVKKEIGQVGAKIRQLYPTVLTRKCSPLTKKARNQILFT